ncbi:MAG: hypothetical protein EHM23_22655 [Acidobacteria bacterium]|nr:MAG: hypothetical protein EHM23_22655 [Acidobacteriota bacterium]
MKDGKPASPQADDKLEALYEFDESRATALLDRSGRGSDLHLEGTGRFRWRPKHGGVQLRHPARLSTGPVSGKRISSSLLNSHEFSLEAWITPRNLFQRGPATILALAGPGDSSNVLLGQSTKDLVFWVRTPVSGLGLTTLSVTTTNQPLGRRLTHVIAVFREGQLELFVNGVRSGRLNLKRDALIGLPARRTSGAKAAYAFFYFFPFALLWSARFGRKTGRTDAGGSFFSVLSPWLPGLAAMGLLILGESIQAGSAGRSFDLPFVGLGILVIAVATVVGRISSTARQPE